MTFGHTYGGTNLMFFNVPACTSGFTVKETGTGVAGLLTAVHCGNSQNYNGFGSDGTYALTFESEELDANSDVQWHTDTHLKAPEFYADSTTFHRTVQSVIPYSSVIVGQPVCHRGQTTGYSCGQVTSKTFAPPWGCGPGASSRVTTFGSKLRETSWRAILETAGAMVP